MNAYLIIYGQAQWTQDDIIKGHLRYQEDLVRTGVSKDNWSLANSAVEPGDEVFLMRTGEPRPRGIIGHGVATSGQYEAEHWKRAGGVEKCADVEFDAINLIGPPVIPLSVLETLPGQQVWTPRQSGIEIKPDALVVLRWLWANATKERGV